MLRVSPGFPSCENSMQRENDGLVLSECFPLVKKGGTFRPEAGLHLESPELVPIPKGGREIPQWQRHQMPTLLEHLL